MAPSLLFWHHYEKGMPQPAWWSQRKTSVTGKRGNQPDQCLPTQTNPSWSSKFWEKIHSCCASHSIVEYFLCCHSKVIQLRSRTFCSVSCRSDKVMHHSNCHAIMASFSFGCQNMEAVGAQFFPPKIFTLNWELTAFSFSYFRKVRLLLNIIALQHTLRLLDLYFVRFRIKHAILVSI